MGVSFLTPGLKPGTPSLNNNVVMRSGKQPDMSHLTSSARIRENIKYHTGNTAYGQFESKSTKDKRTKYPGTLQANPHNKKM